jgi:lysozyme family protein
MTDAAYLAEWRLKNPEKVKKHRQNALPNKKAYTHENYKRVSIYKGVCTCPKCGKKGYASDETSINTITQHKTPYLLIRHQHYLKGKTIFDNYCYFGAVFHD